MRPEVLERFYKLIAPFFDVVANDAFLLTEAGDQPTLKSLTEAAKRSANALVTRPDYAQFPANASQAGRVLAMDAALPRALAVERQTFIDEITQGRSQFSVMTAWGSRKVYDSATGEEVQYSPAGGQRKPGGNAWANLTNEQVRDLHKRVVEERRLKNLSPSELRREITPQRHKYEAPSREPMESSTGYVLVNPETNREFTKIELIKFLNGGRGNASQILVHRDSRVIIPDAVARMKEILGVSR